MKNFYPSWQEASSAATSLGISSSTNYIKVARGLDVRLPSNPNLYYKDFPGWHEFLLKNKIKFYPTWQEASKAAIALGMNSHISYDYRLDSRLPCNPNTYYQDFPGWKEFLDIKKEENYPTWQEASLSAIDMYIYGPKEYKIKYDRDPKLPKHHDYFYKDFPGWKEFLGKNLTEKARTYGM